MTALCCENFFMHVLYNYTIHVYHDQLYCYLPNFFFHFTLKSNLRTVLISGFFVWEKPDFRFPNKT